MNFPISEHGVWLEPHPDGMVWGRKGHGHFNCRENRYVVAKLQERGFVLDARRTDVLRSICELPYLRHTLMVFSP